MAKRRAGLHKEISSIFNGVPIPKNTDMQQRPYAPAPERSDHEKESKPDKGSELSDGQKLSSLISNMPTPDRKQRSMEPSSTAKPAPSQPLKATKTKKSAKGNPLQETWRQIEKKLFAPKPGVDAGRQKKMLILIPILFIVLIFVLVQVLGTSPRNVKGDVKNASAKASTAGADNGIHWQIPEPYPTTLRDPMQFGSTATAQTEAGKLIVKGIFYSEDKPSAAIDNQIVHEGDKILGATIIKINKDNVEFEVNGKRWTQKVRR